MIAATPILSAGKWSGVPADTLLLAQNDGSRHRTVMRCVDKTVFLLNLPDVPSLVEGDALELEDGRLIAVRISAGAPHGAAGNGARHHGRDHEENCGCGHPHHPYHRHHHHAHEQN